MNNTNDFQYVFNDKWTIVFTRRDMQTINTFNNAYKHQAIPSIFLDIVCSMPKSLLRLDDNIYITKEKMEDGKDENGNIKTKDVEDEEEIELLEEMLGVPGVFMAKQTYLRDGNAIFEIHTHEQLTDDQIRTLHKNVLECYPQDDLETYLYKTYKELGIDDNYNYYLDVYEDKTGE